jgi:hypothetical protein
MNVAPFPEKFSAFFILEVIFNIVVAVVFKVIFAWKCIKIIFYYYFLKFIFDISTSK